MAEMRKIRQQLCVMRVTLEASWLLSGVNGWADMLSRRQYRNSWLLAPAFFAALDRRWGRHTVDRFETCGNTHFARFNSKLSNAGIREVDALQQPRGGENNWANSPLSMTGDWTCHLYVPSEFFFLYKGPLTHTQLSFLALPTHILSRP